MSTLINPKTIKEARYLVQSWIDSYLAIEADDTTIEILCDTAAEHCQMLDNVVHTRWFMEVLADDILSNGGMRA